MLITRAQFALVPEVPLNNLWCSSLFFPSFSRMLKGSSGSDEDTADRSGNSEMNIRQLFTNIAWNGTYNYSKQVY